LLGFGTIIALWALASVTFARRLEDADRRSAIISARYLRARDRLAVVQTQIVLGSVYVRDALLDTDPAQIERYGRQMLDAYSAVDRALADYEPVVPSPDIQAQIGDLRREVQDFRTARLGILKSGAGLSKQEAADLLRQQVLPQRERLLDLSRQIETIDHDAYEQQQAEIGRIQADTGGEIWRSLVAALFATLLVAALATTSVDRLERHVRQQREGELRAAAEIQQLSTRLMTAHEDERRSISRELHDEVGQILTALKMRLASLGRASALDARSEAAVEEARELAGRALQAVRNVSQLVHPPVLDDLGLAVALETHVRYFTDGQGLRVEFEATGLDDRRLAPQTERAAYRIVQEALTNVAKHARARLCQVRVVCTDSCLTLTVDDDGVGIDRTLATQGTPPGVGLVGIRERVSQLGGTFRLESNAGRGTRHSVELPVDQSPAGETPAAQQLHLAHTGVMTHG
jgi:signal transduction histidine kinase